jgi:hypothetical protein
MSASETHMASRSRRTAHAGHASGSDSVSPRPAGYGALLRYCERRRFIRVPVTGPVNWRSGKRTGTCELVDLSPGGAGLRMGYRRAAHLGARLTLEVEILPGVIWELATDARVVRRVHDSDGQCLVGVQFSSPNEP